MFLFFLTSRREKLIKSFKNLSIFTKEVTDENKLSDLFLTILQCPICEGQLDLSEDKSELRCKKCRRIFEVKDGIPILTHPKG